MWRTKRNLKECLENAEIMRAYTDKPLRFIASPRDKKFIERCGAKGNPIYQMSCSITAATHCWNCSAEAHDIE